MLGPTAEGALPSPPPRPEPVKMHRLQLWLWLQSQSEQHWFCGGIFSLFVLFKTIFFMLSRTGTVTGPAGRQLPQQSAIGSLPDLLPI
jgi:hypothetical protein